MSLGYARKMWALDSPTLTVEAVTLMYGLSGQVTIPMPAFSTLASALPPPPPAVIAPPVTPKRVVTVTQTAPAPTVLVTVPASAPLPIYGPPPTVDAPPPWHSQPAGRR